VQIVFALFVACRATKKFIDGHLFLDEDRLEEKEAQRRNIPMHVFCGFLEKLARDVEQELARQKALQLPTAQFEATLDSLRRHQSVLELRFSPHLSFSLAACSLFFALALALALASPSLSLYLFLPPCVPYSLTPLPLPLPPCHLLFPLRPCGTHSSQSTSADAKIERQRDRERETIMNHSITRCMSTQFRRRQPSDRKTLASIHISKSTVSALQSHVSGLTEGKIQTIMQLVIEDPEVQNTIKAALELSKKEGPGDGDALEQLLGAAANKWLDNAPMGVCVCVYVLVIGFSAFSVRIFLFLHANVCTCL